MKKAKRLAVVLLTVLMCLSLCGCQNLEDMRAAHAFWQEDGSILWDGNVYQPLTTASEKMGIILGEDVVWVTEEDVPVLLSEVFGEFCRASRSGAILITYGHNGETLYCREDMYDFMTEHLENPELTTYYYTYWDYESSEECFYYLSEVQGNTINRLITTLDFTSMNEDFYYAFEGNDFLVSLNKCDDEHLFSESDVLEIARKDGTVYLITPDGHIAEVPSEYDDIMKAIVSVYYNEEVRPYT